MKTRTPVVILLSLVFSCAMGQPLVNKPEYLRIDVKVKDKQLVFEALDTLFSQADRGSIDSSIIAGKGFDLSKSELESLKDYTQNVEKGVSYQRQLINFYPLSDSTFMLTLAWSGCKPGGIPETRLILNIIACRTGDKIVFSLPLHYHTRNWNRKIVGDIVYYFPDSLNMERAEEFNRKNTLIAQRLGVAREGFTFYICPNYQEILRLIGYTYDLSSNGKYTDGYGVVPGNIIFSVMGHEDFSHDVFHFYSRKINKSRNWIAEEGMAYNYGNAYYTKPDGSMITQAELVGVLKGYLQEHPDSSLLSLFMNDTRIFDEFSSEISVRSCISGILMREIEKRTGMQGVLRMIRCGKGIDNYMLELKTLISVDSSNFDKEISNLLKTY